MIVSYTSILKQAVSLAIEEHGVETCTAAINYLILAAEAEYYHRTDGLISKMSQAQADDLFTEKYGLNYQVYNMPTHERIPVSFVVDCAVAIRARKEKEPVVICS